MCMFRCFQCIKQPRSCCSLENNGSLRACCVSDATELQPPCRSSDGERERERETANLRRRHRPSSTGQCRPSTPAETGLCLFGRDSTLALRGAVGCCTLFHQLPSDDRSQVAQPKQLNQALPGGATRVQSPPPVVCVPRFSLVADPRADSLARSPRAPLSVQAKAVAAPAYRGAGRPYRSSAGHGCAVECLKKYSAGWALLSLASSVVRGWA